MRASMYWFVIYAWRFLEKWPRNGVERRKWRMNVYRPRKTQPTRRSSAADWLATDKDISFLLLQQSDSAYCCLVFIPPPPLVLSFCFRILLARFDEKWLGGINRAYGDTFVWWCLCLLRTMRWPVVIRLISCLTATCLCSLRTRPKKIFGDLATFPIPYTYSTKIVGRW